jgi:hypothetical protein
MKYRCLLFAVNSDIIKAGVTNMKYLEVPDFHFAPEWADVNQQCANKIAEAANANSVDFIAMPGDIYDHPIMTSDRGGINKLRNIIKKLTSICPVVAVYGTPSHEAPGSLEPLKDAGLIVLEPGKAYGFYYQNDKNIIIEIKQSIGYMDPELVLFGIPELNKKNIQAHLGLSAEQANAEAINLARKYITEFIAPIRLKHEKIPAVLLMHGNVSDSSRENENDIVLKASDIVIHTEDLRVANLDRVTLGHIHKPWESKVILAGYAGSWGKNWGETGFKPGMNLVTIDPPNVMQLRNWSVVNVTRIPYGTPKRLKIIAPLESYDPEVAYWLHSKDPDAKLPAGQVHPWSRVTFDEKRKETRRVSQEQAANIKTLADLFKLADPSVSKSVLEKVDSIEKKIGVSTNKKIDISIDSVEVTGCTLFSGHTAKFNINSLNYGVSGIRGNNGSGKSSLLSFLTPYPVVVGKDTKSGRSSAIKDFFESPDSKIVKHLTVNDQQHEHIIIIKGAHTQNAKVECYLNIDGEPQLDKGTFDEIMTMCESLYGSFNDYLLTTFYVQPLQGKTQAGLMGANMTDIRDLVQSIAGIDRDSEKRDALDKVSELNTEIKRLEAWLTGAQEFELDTKALGKSISEHKEELRKNELEINNIIEKGKAAKEALEKVQENKYKTDNQKAEKTKDESRIFEISNIILDIKDEISVLSKIDAATIEKKLDDNDKAVEHNRKAAEIKTNNANLITTWERERDAFIAEVKQSNINKKYEYEKKKNEIESAIKNAKAILGASVESCPNCGYIDPAVTEKIDQAKKELADNTEKLNRLSAPVFEDELFSKPEPETQPEIEEVSELTATEKQELQEELNNARQAASIISEKTNKIKELNKEEQELLNKSYDIDSLAETKVLDAQSKYDSCMDSYRVINSRKVALETMLTKEESDFEKAEEVATKINNARKDIKTNTANRDDWDYIARMLQPSKIPAIELELVLDSIDAEATRIIESYHESRFSFTTETQQQGKAGSVDRFDIRIHDNETGKEKSFLENSPGQKAFFADAYTKALVRQRNERMMRKYSPIIMDESDGPIQPELISSYYEVQRRFWTDSRVLVVSHSPTSHEYIDQSIEMEDILI